VYYVTAAPDIRPSASGCGPYFNCVRGTVRQVRALEVGAGMVRAGWPGRLIWNSGIILSWPHLLWYLSSSGSSLGLYSCCAIGRYLYGRRIVVVSCRKRLIFSHIRLSELSRTSIFLVNPSQLDRLLMLH
jgi:hypothetical protein